MRTTLDIDDDILQAAKELSRRQKKTTGKMISDLARKGLSHSNLAPTGSAKAVFLGFEPFPHRGGLVTNELIDRLRAEEEA
jgi:hypothetical protein